MQILPDERSSRWVALGLLVIALVIGYMVFLNPWVQKHRQLNGLIASQKESVANMRAVAEQAPEVRERLRQVRNAQMDAAFFLEDTQHALASAWLQNEIETLVNDSVQPNETCQVANRSPVRVRDFERFEPVQINVRIICGPETLRELFYRIETSVPYMFLDEVAITQVTSRVRQARLRGQAQAEMEAPSLNVQFSVVGYIRSTGGGAS